MAGGLLSPLFQLVQALLNLLDTNFVEMCFGYNLGIFLSSIFRTITGYSLAILNASRTVRST